MQTIGCNNAKWVILFSLTIISLIVSNMYLNMYDEKESQHDLSDNNSPICDDNDDASILGDIFLDEDGIESENAQSFSSPGSVDTLWGYSMDITHDPISGVRISVNIHGVERVARTDDNGYYIIRFPHTTETDRSVSASHDEYYEFRTTLPINGDTCLNITLIEKKDAKAFIEGEGNPLNFLAFGIITTLFLIFYKNDRKYAIMGTLAPLYTKLQKNQILAHKTRKELYSYLEKNPGVNYTQLRKAMSLGTSSLVHHLGILEKEGYIRSRKELGRRLFFPKGISLPLYSGSSSLPPSPIQRQILDHLLIHGPTPLNGLANNLPMKRSTLNYSLYRLKDRGLVCSSRTGRSVIYHIVGDQ